MTTTVTTKPSPIEQSHENTDTEAEAAGRAALRPEINALYVINAFKDDFGCKGADLGLMMEHLETSIQEVKNGNLIHLESMLLGQATTLQALFTSFATKASRQQHLPNLQAFMTMALKAQAQSRATLQTLVDLKNPKQPTYVRQANIAQGPQQVNNGQAGQFAGSHAKQEAVHEKRTIGEE